MKKFFLLFVPILGFFLMGRVEAGGRYKPCPDGMEQVQTDSAKGWACAPKSAKAPPLPRPIIQSFEPTTVDPGKTILIRGSNFGGGAVRAIKFENAAETNKFEVVSGTELKAVVPDTTMTGPVALVVESNSGSRSFVTSAQKLQIHMDLQVIKVTPPNGKWAEHINVDVKRIGNGGWDDCNINFGGVDYGSWNLEHYPPVATLGMNVPKEVKNNEIVISCKNGIKASSGDKFQFISSDPKITSIAPAGGIEKNNQISIFGANLGGAKEVTFNGVKGSINTGGSDQIRVIVPNMDGAVKIVVTTPQGSTSWDNYNIFKNPPLPEWKPPAKPVAEAPKVTAPPTKLPDLGQLKNPVPIVDPGKLAGNNGSGITNTDPLKDKGDTLPGGNALKDKTKLTTADPLIGNAGASLKDKMTTLPGGNALRTAQSAKITPQPAMCPPGQSMTDRGCLAEQKSGSRPALKPEIKPQPIIKEPIAEKLPDVAPVITKAPASVDAEGEVTIHGKNFIRVGGKSDLFNVKQVLWVKGNSEVEAKGMGAVANPQEEDKISFKAPKEAGTYSIKVVTAKGTTVWNNPLISVQSPGPIITKAPASVDAEGEVTIHGKNFIRVGGKSDLFNVKQVLWVKGNSEVEAKGMGAVANPQEEDKISFKAPKEAGTYSIKVVTAKGTTVWNKPLVSVIQKTPPVPVITGVSKTKVEVGEALTLRGKNLIAQDSSGFTSMNFDKLFFVKGRTETRITAINGGPKKGEEQSINFSAPKATGSYSIKIVTKSGGIVTWNNPMVAVVDTAAEAAKQKALEAELAKKKAQEELAQKQAEERQKAMQEAMKQREHSIQPSSEERQMTPPPQAEEPAVARQEPQPQEEQHYCAQGTWSPTLQTCVQDQAPEEAAPPDCGAGSHWSPTLKSCQAD